jgi:hypothetical protein
MLAIAFSRSHARSGISRLHQRVLGRRPPQLRVTIDVDLMPYEVSLTLGILERLLGDVAEMTSGARVNHHFMHGVILCATGD